MGAVTIPNNFVQGAASVADDVDENFEELADHINTELVHKDGSVAMTGALSLPGNPGSALQAAPKQYVDALLGVSGPSGAIAMFGGSAAPSGWLLCDGSAISRSTYATLFAAVGTTHGAGNGSTTFNVPDLRGRVPVGSGAGPALTARTAGTQFGTETVGTSAASTSPGNFQGVQAGANYNHSDISHSHPTVGTVQPSTCVAFIIKT